jgi:YkoY family integral membrane protein
MEHLTLLHAITIILTLIVLEGLLSADNALVLAIMVKHLPKGRQKKALLYGIVGAFIFRFLMLAAAQWIIRLWYLCAAGALYLAFIALRHFLFEAKTEAHEPKRKRGFWGTVVIVEFTDVVFAVDSVLAAVALSNRLWLVYTGCVLGIIAMRFAAGGFLALLEKWPGLEHMAYGLIGWIAIKLGIQSWGMYTGTEAHLPPAVFWSGMGLIIALGVLLSIQKSKRAY